MGVRGAFGVIAWVVVAACSRGDPGERGDQRAPAADPEAPPKPTGARPGGCARYLPLVRAAGFANPRVKIDDDTAHHCTYAVEGKGDPSLTIHLGMGPDYDGAKSAVRPIDGAGVRAEVLDDWWLSAWRDDGAVVSVQWLGGAPLPEGPALALAKAVLPRVEAPVRRQYTDKDFAERGYCEIKVSGGLDDAIRIPGAGSMSISTVYWQGEDAMAALLLNCGDPIAGEGFYVNFILAKGTPPELFPYGPKTYEMAENADEPGQISRTVSRYRGVRIRSRGKESFSITRFDGTRIAGTFHIPATVKPKGAPVDVVIDGSFELPCVGSACAK